MIREVKLREKVKAAGGRWDPERRVRHLAMEQVLQLGPGGRVINTGASTPPDPAREQSGTGV
jgi:hypothetical protein